MPVTEESRHRLHQALDRTIGSEEATTLMEHLPPVGWADVATKTDLAHLEERIDLRFESLETRMDGRFGLVDARFESLETGMDGRFESLATGMDGRFGLVDARFEAVRSHSDDRFDGVDLRFTAAASETGHRFDSVDKRLEIIEQRLAGIDARLSHQFWQTLVFLVLMIGFILGVLGLT